MIKDFVFEKRIEASEVDFSRKLRFTDLLKIFQDACCNQMEILGCGKKEVLEKGYLWIICKTHFEIYRRPFYMEDVIVKTHPGKIKKFLYPRYFTIEDKNGNILVKLNSIWVIMNEKTRKIALPIESGVTQEGEDEIDNYTSASIIKDKEVSFIGKRDVIYGDIDLNGHLNNVNYLQFMLDTHDTDYYKKHEIKEIEINYLKEVKEKETLSIYANEDDHSSFFIFKKEDGTIVFKGQILYK